MQCENAHIPIDVTLSGMMRLVKLVQPENAQSSIDVTVSGMVTLVKLVQSRNAALPIDVTPAGTSNTPLISPAFIKIPFSIII